MPKQFTTYTPMQNANTWTWIDHFTRHENWGDADLIDARLVLGLDQIRKYVGKKIVIHCGYEMRPQFSWHSHYRAVDVHIDGMHVVDQFLVFSRFGIINGIGVYPCWNSPGCHIDTRPTDKKFDFNSRWICFKSGEYKPLTWEHLKKCA